jgi:flavorubredoxin
MTTELTKGIFWVGYIDWSVRNFHGYVTSRGSTYNAYLITGPKNVLIDTVKEPFAAAYLEHVEEHVPLDKIDYLVCNHAEPDHSGSLPAAMDLLPNATLLCNAKCKDALAHYYDISGWKIQIVKDTEKLDIGGRTLQFFDTPMVHWPESMATYVVEDGLLFSMDAFGQHYASAFRFDDESNLAEVFQEAKTYYANIVLPYGRPVAAALKRLGALKLNIVAPSHGVIWRKHFGDILQRYTEWMVCKPTRKVLVIYCSMWHSTEKMAEAVAAGAEESPVDVKLINVDTVNDTQIVTEAMDCAAMAFGSPTLNQGLMPRMAATLTYLRGLKPAGKASFAFGSYGWAAKGAEEVASYLAAMQTAPVRDTLTVRFAPDAATLDQCREAGRLLAQAAMKA